MDFSSTPFFYNLCTLLFSLFFKYPKVNIFGTSVTFLYPLNSLNYVRGWDLTSIVRKGIYKKQDLSKTRFSCFSTAEKSGQSCGIVLPPNYRVIYFTGPYWCVRNHLLYMIYGLLREWRQVTSMQDEALLYKIGVKKVNKICTSMKTWRYSKCRTE